MPKYITRMSYSSGSWARMINNPGDRHTALTRVMESLGGTLESLYWQFGTQDALAIADFPDAVSAGAMNTAVTKTGAFKMVETHELLTQKQLNDILLLARGVAEDFEVPGHAD